MPGPEANVPAAVLMTDPLLTIVVPCYNLGKTLQRTLDSLQDYAQNKLCEIIYIDDQSTDETGQFISRWLQNTRGALYTNSKNLGLHGSRVQGLQRARGKYTWFVDGGDSVVYHHELFETLRVASADVIRFIHEINRQDKLQPSTLKSVVWGKFWRTAFLRDYPVFDFEYRMAWEDEIVATRMRAFISSEISLPDTYYIYYVDDESNVLSLKQYRAEEAIIIDELLTAGALSRKSAAKAIKTLFRMMLGKRHRKITGSLGPTQKAALVKLSIRYAVTPVKTLRLIFH